MIKPEIVRQIIDASRIEEVVGDFVSLKKRGVNLLGLCPFHNEKTPSFTVSPSKGIYKCFGCDKGGNAVNFIMEHEQMSYPEALKYLASKYQIEIEEEAISAEEIAQQGERESMLQLNQFAARYFTQQLFETEAGKSIGLSYLKQRGYREQILHKFGLGYNPDEWEAFSKHSLENGYKKEWLVRTGLSIDKQDRLIDRFKGRIIFPIHNLTGKVIGFGGRILKKDASKAKYLNSPESDLYNKSRVLYGLFQAKQSIVAADNCYLVEGYTDVISLHQAGIENVVASSGTALTEDQIRLIKRYTQHITILFDGDAAGIKASFRGIDMILAQGMQVRIVLFPEGEDPDSFVSKHSHTETEAFLKNQTDDFIKFKTKLLQKDAAHDPIKKAELIREIVQTISHIPDAIFRSVYIKECSNLLDIPEQSLMTELNKLLRKKYQSTNRDDIHTEDEKNNKPQKSDKTELEEGIVFQERELLRLLITYADQEVLGKIRIEEGQPIQETITVAAMIVNDILADEVPFSLSLHQKVFDAYAEHLKNNSLPDLNDFLHSEDEDLKMLVVNLISHPYHLSDNWKKNKIYIKEEKEILLIMIQSALLSIKSSLVSKLMKESMDKLREVNNEEDQLLLMQQYKKLKEVSVLINNKLSRIVH